MLAKQKLAVFRWWTNLQPGNGDLDARDLRVSLLSSLTCPHSRCSRGGLGGCGDPGDLWIDLCCGFHFFQTSPTSPPKSLGPAHPTNASSAERTCAQPNVKLEETEDFREIRWKEAKHCLKRTCHEQPNADKNAKQTTNHFSLQ